MKTTSLSKYVVTELSDRDGHEYTLVISFKSSWGEVDAILPVLSLLKAQQDVRIIAVFSSKRFFERNTVMPFLDYKLSEVADVIVRPIRFANGVRGGAYRLFRKITLRLRWRDDFAWIFRRLVTPGSVDVILEPVGPVRPVQQHIRNWCRTASVIVFQHSTALLLSKPGEEAQPRDEDRSADAMLYSSPYGADHLDTIYPSIGNVVWTGFPRYDRWWVDQILSDPEYRRSAERSHAVGRTPVFALFTTHIREDVISSSAFGQLVSDIAQVVFAYPNSFLIVKPHPRLKGGILESVLAEFPDDRWMMSGLQALQIGEIVDLVISMPSSTMLDNVVMKKPVIEFFDYQTLHAVPVFQTKDGQPCTEYVYAGYVSYARGADELRTSVNRLLQPVSNGSAVTEYETARSQLQLDDNASQRSVDVICQYLGTARSDET